MGTRFSYESCGCARFDLVGRIGKELAIVLATPGGQAYWKLRGFMFTPDFAAYVEEAVGNTKVLESPLSNKTMKTVR